MTTRKFLPVTDEVIHSHLSGEQTVGIYPLLQDDTCWFLEVDLDKKTRAKTPWPFSPDPWTLPLSRKKHEAKIEGPFRPTVNVVRSNLIFVEKKGLPPAMLNRLLRIAAFQNPEFYKAQAIRLSTFGKPRIIACGADLPRYLALPRECLSDLLSLLESHASDLLCGMNGSQACRLTPNSMAS